MSDILKVIKEIGKGRNLEMNLPKYMNYMMSAYYRNSSIRLAMNYYTYLTMEQEEEQSSEWTALTARLDKVIKSTILSEFDGTILEEAVKEIDSIRNQLIADTKTVTLYADQFQIYEYILNRMEGRFEEAEALPLNYSDDKFVQRLLEYMMQDQDRSVISQKITEIVSTLPVRLTKQRYYEIVKDSFLLFVGSERQALEDHVFMLKSSAALLLPETESDPIRYQEMDVFLKELKEVDWDALTLEQYQMIQKKLYQVSTEIDRITNLSTLLIEVINDVYILLLSMPYALTEAEEAATCKEIMRRSQTVSDHSEEEELFALFEQLEGKQERISEQLTVNASLLDSLEQQKELMESIMLDKIYHSLLRIEKLASTSHFIELDAAVDRTIVDHDYAEQRAHEVIGEFAECFKGCSRRKIRSMMAASMMALPIFFKNADELKEYAKTALSSCSDAEEKRSSVILLKTIMESLPNQMEKE